MFDLTGKRALVCGGTRGIGRAAAEALAKQGASVTLLARDAGLLAVVAQGLDAARGQKHDWRAADFQDPEAVSQRMQEFVAAGHYADILINNTGGPAPGAILDAQPDQFLAAMRMHLLCNQALVQALAPGMKQRRFGRIINIISTSVRQPIPNLGVSNTTRAAVAGWAKTLAGELAPFGITVNNVLPGYTSTERLQALIEHRARQAGQDSRTIAAAMEADIPMRRFAAPEEIAAAVAFLASPAAGYITGVSLPVDGGRISAI